MVNTPKSITFTRKQSAFSRINHEPKNQVIKKIGCMKEKTDLNINKSKQSIMIKQMIKDKVILITGASSGIGYTTALTLSRAGATIVAGARRVDKLESLKKAVRDQNGEILINQLDVTKREECANICKFGHR